MLTLKIADNICKEKVKLKLFRLQFHKGKVFAKLFSKSVRLFKPRVFIVKFFLLTFSPKEKVSYFFLIILTLSPFFIAQAFASSVSMCISTLKSSLTLTCTSKNFVAFMPSTITST